MFCPVCELDIARELRVRDDGTPVVERLTSDNTVRDHSEARFVRSITSVLRGGDG